MQRRHPGWKDLRHRRHRKQRGSSPRQHGDLRPLHQHLDSPAVAALPALQTRLCRHQKVHSEWLRVAHYTGSSANTSWAPGCGTRGDCSLGPGWLVSDLWTWLQHPPTPSHTHQNNNKKKVKQTNKQKKALCRMYSCSTTQPSQLMMPNLQYCVCIMVIVHHPTGTGTFLVKAPWFLNEVILSVVPSRSL